MAKIELTICDRSGDDKAHQLLATKHYSVVSEGRKKEYDLCEEHGAPLEAFLEGARARGGARGSNRVNRADRLDGDITGTTTGSTPAPRTSTDKGKAKATTGA